MAIGGVDDIDVEEEAQKIGAVEIKDATANTRASVIAPNTAAAPYYATTMAARYMLTPPTLTDTFTSPLLLDSVGKLRVVPDGYYVIATNAIPSTTGLIFHSAAAAPDATTQTIRTTGGSNAADALVAANIWGLDARSLEYSFNGTTWDRKRDVAALADATLAGTLNSFHNAETGIPVTVIMGHDSTAGAMAYRALHLSALGAISVDVDGVYVAVTNPDPDNVGLIVHENAAAPADTNQTVRTTGGVATATITSANFFGVDTRSKLYAQSGANEQELDAVAVSATLFGLGVGVFDALGNRMPAADVVTRSLFAAVGDGTTTAVVETAGTKKALNVNLTDGTNDMPTMDANTRAGFVKVTDGAQEWSIDASGFGQIDIAAQSLTAVKVSKDANANIVTNPLWAELTDGTAAISATNPLDAQIGDGTNVLTLLAGATKTLPCTIHDGTTLAPVNTAFGETESEATASLFVGGLLYGLDTEGVATSQLRALQIAVDNAGVSGTPNVLVTGGIYKNALDTYDDNDAVPFHFDVNGRVLTDAKVTLNDYTDDSNEFTVATSMVLAMGAVATSDAVDAGDVGAVAMTTSRELKVATAATNKPAVTNATGALAINTTTAVANHFKLSSVTVHFSAAPTTSENLTVTLDALDGVAYDTVLFSVDPSATSATDIVFIPNTELLFESGDEIKVAFANTDLRTYGLRIVSQVV